MSVLFGQWNIDGRPFDFSEICSFEQILSPYAPDGVRSQVTTNVAILFGAMHTTREAEREIQPLVLASKAVVCWDGRLDNRSDLISALTPSLTTRSPDASIVGAAYESWGTGFLRRLVGEWSLSVWNPVDHSLLLARDPFGTRHLHFMTTGTEVIWSTILGAMLLPGRRFTIDEEYLAGWFASLPAAERTPYTEIRSVPPSCSVVVRRNSISTHQYWNVANVSEIRHRADRGYEEQFRNVLADSVRRRLRSNGPVTAELSGGMDSSAIVCMADTLVSRGAAEPVATVSYYDDAEPNWNERPYFSAVEEKRGRTGYHIDTGAEGNFEFEFNEDAFAATPSSVVRPSPAARKFKQYLVSSGSRIVLSGIGGDETMGGVPTLLPEICDLLVRGQFISFFRKELQFALRDRAPVIKVLAKTCSFFLPSWANTRVKGGSPLPWLNPSFVHRYRAALHGYESRLTVFGPLPSIQENLRAFAALQRQLGCSPLSSDPPCEKRYPYLDRDLVEFVCAIPREQLVRLNQRRSLMRRALRGIVPDIILDRKRKAYVSRGPLVGLSRNFERLSSLASTMVAGTLGIVDPERLWQAVKKAQDCKDVPIIPVMRTLMVEFWLRSLSRQGLKNAGDSLHIGIHRPPVGPRWELQVGRTDFS